MPKLELMEKLPVIIECPDLEATIALGQKIAASLKPGDVLALEGDLGSGKTTFVKGIASGLGLKNKDAVKSPTFVLMHIYETAIPLIHVDLYRLENQDEMETLGLQEYIDDGKSIVCVEWAEKIEKLLQDGTYRIKFEWVSSSSRKIHIEKKRMSVPS